MSAVKKKGRILVTGANGQLALAIQDIAVLYPEYDFLFLTRQELPIHDGKVVRELFDSYAPTHCINCAAYTAVDLAESNQEEAFVTNGKGAALLAETSRSYNSCFIHLSTDYVFNGKATSPYKEDEPLNPINQYGESKARGEKMVAESNPDAVILRTSWVYSEHGRNFVKTMVRLLSEKPEIRVVSDQFGSPTYAGDLAAAILRIIASDKILPGVYHYCNEGVISWYEFADTIKSLIGSNCVVVPITTNEYPTPAQRPAYSALSTEKIRKTFLISVPAWQESLAVCLKKLMGKKL